MGWIPVVLGLAACVLLYGTENQVVFWLAVFTAVGTFWSYGVMHNFATEAAKRRSSYKGKFYDITAKETDSVPNSIAGMNLLFSLASIGLLMYGVSLVQNSFGRWVIQQYRVPVNRQTHRPQPKETQRERIMQHV